MNILDRIKIYNQLMDEKKKKEKEEAKKRLKRDEKGKPILKLTPLEKTVVNTKTQEEYDTLMQVYECGSWKWSGLELPTSKNCWNIHKEETSIGSGYTFWENIKEKFGSDERGNYQKYGWKVISTQDFYKEQKITKEQIKEIKDYFKK